MPHGGGGMQHLSLCDWFLSLRAMSSRFMPVVGSVRIPFLVQAE